MEAFYIMQESLRFLAGVAQDKQEVAWSWKKPDSKNNGFDWRDDDSRANDRFQPDAEGRLCFRFEALLQTPVGARPL